MFKLLHNIGTTSLYDVKKSIRDAVIFAAALFLVSFIGGLDQSSLFANSWESVRVAAMSGVDAVYGAWLALLMPMLMRAVRETKAVPVV